VSKFSSGISIQLSLIKENVHCRSIELTNVDRKQGHDRRGEEGGGRQMEGEITKNYGVHFGSTATEPFQHALFSENLLESSISFNGQAPVQL